MISLVNNFDFKQKNSAEYIKIKCLFDTYKHDDKVLFWVQDDNKALISMTDGNMIICNNNANIDELKDFVEVLGPVSIYSDYETLCAIDKKPLERINVMSRFCDFLCDTKSDILKSDEIYRLLDVEGLSLPKYPYFAVDYCKRLNLGNAKYFAIKEKCAIITFNCDDLAIVCGLSSKQKGYGTIALNGAITQNYNKQLFVCCRDKVKGFYEKNGFKPHYFSGYWVKNYECN